jgi:Icc-related predicted phosphoesterase
MKIHVLSDLHTEFAKFIPPETNADVVILAGDIGVGSGGMEWAASQFQTKPVIYIPGNHEYYHHNIDSIDTFRTAAPDNIDVLNDDTLVLDDVRFLGSTLWTDFRFNGDGEAWFARNHAKLWMEDFSSIRNGFRSFTPEDSVYLHRRSVAWLVDELEKDFDGSTVVVTHHLPAAKSVDKRYANDPLNPAFASRLEGIIEKYQPEVWIHGHTHVSCDYEIFGTRVVCNPRGYPLESGARGFSPELVVEA